MKSATSFLLLAIVVTTSACTEKLITAKSTEKSKATADGSLVASPSIPTPEASARLFQSVHKKGDLAGLCKAALNRTREKITEIINVKAPAFENTVLAFETASADFIDDTMMLTFMKHVSTDKDAQAEGAECEELVGNFITEALTNRKLYTVLKTQAGRNAGERRLAEKMLLGFEENGMSLSDENLAKFIKLNEQLNKKQAAFSNNLGLDKSRIEVSKEELAGLPQDFIDRQAKTAEGKLIVNANGADGPMLLANASNEQTRFKMMKALYTRGGPANIKLLEESIVIRQQLAKLLLPAQNKDGSPADQTWVENQLRSRMAKTRKTATEFLEGLKDKLSERNRQEFAEILAFKKTLDPNATELNIWDVSYLGNQMKKKNLSLDEEEIRKYFPTEVVLQGLFGVYSEMLGVEYREVAGARVWAEGVKLYEIRERSDGRLIGYFYTDLFPRPGKFGHGAAFPLISGRILPQGYYSLPISAIVTNFSPPAAGQPSLLSHMDVSVLFHEFGHIMHQTLTRAPYATLAGSQVARDFVEAPSQMLENWVWEPEILRRLSGHVNDRSQKLPEELLSKMIQARDFQQGIFNTRQLLLGLFDLKIHSQSEAVDVTKTFADLHFQLTSLNPIDQQLFPASFGHLMGGYDAGYYSYLWSKVYAQDMYAVFKAAGLSNQEVGRRYRKVILEHGNMKEALDLLPQFLERAPSKDAFYSDLHIVP